MPATLARPSPGNANALISRRALGDIPIRAATDAFTSLAATGLNAAADAAGRAAGKAAKTFVDTFLPPVMATPAADTPVAAPPRATNVAEMVSTTIALFSQALHGRAASFLCPLSIAFDGA